MINKETLYSAYQVALEEVLVLRDRIRALRKEGETAAEEAQRRPGSIEQKLAAIRKAWEPCLIKIAEAEAALDKAQIRADAAWDLYRAAPIEPEPATPLETTGDEVVLRLPREELALFLAVLHAADESLGRRGSDEMDLAKIVPDLRSRQAMMRQYHAWNGDPEEWEASLQSGDIFAEARSWQLGSALYYLTRRMENACPPDVLEQVASLDKD